MSRFAADRKYNAQKVLRILQVDKDSDDEDFDEPETSMREADEKREIKQDDAQEENSLQNEVPTLPVRGKTINREGTIWVPTVSFHHKLYVQI